MTSLELRNYGKGDEGAELDRALSRAGIELIHYRVCALLEMG
jgi:hypothetical protein